MPVELQYHRLVMYQILAYSAQLGVWVLAMFISWCPFTWVLMKEMGGTWQAGMHSLWGTRLYMSIAHPLLCSICFLLASSFFVPYSPPNLHAWTGFSIHFSFPLPEFDLETKRKERDAWFGEISVCAGIERTKSYFSGKWDTVRSWAI